MPRWLLPENISDVLPLEARRVEAVRRALLDLYASYGYELVIPPLIEYVDSLLTGTGSDLDLRTFKLVDQASGRMLGLRADITPQVARIDAHILNRAGVTRLCYAGSVLHARPMHALAVREPLQVGAELFGSSSLAADAEILELAIESLRTTGLDGVAIDLGHAGVLRGLLDIAQLPAAVEEEIVAALAAGDLPALRETVAPLPARERDGLLALARLSGGTEVIAEARRALPDSPAIARALDDLHALAAGCAATVTVDLADCHAYLYETGVTFSVHAEGAPGALVRGGRYDNVGKAFGRARPAVGFSIYLRDLAALSEAEPPRAVLAPAGDEPALRDAIRALRASGEVVVQRWEGENGAGSDTVFDRELVRDAGEWKTRQRQ